MKSGEYCPLIQKKCVGHKCAWYTNIVGTDPQSGQETNSWACAVTFVPILQVELANQARGTTASVDNLRNEHDKIARAQCGLMAAMIETQEIEPTTTTLLPN